MSVGWETSKDFFSTIMWERESFFWSSFFYKWRAWRELWQTLQKRMKGVSLCVKSYFKWINILTDGGKERVRGREGSWWREKRIIVCFCAERVLFFGAAERQSLLSGVYQWDRSSEITHPDSRPQTCWRRLTQDYLPNLTWNCVDCQPQHWEICLCILCDIAGEVAFDRCLVLGPNLWRERRQYIGLERVDKERMET